MREGALSHLKVIDISHYIAGPYCTKLLADLGAEVIKIERPGSGDGSRRLGPFPGDIPDREKSGLYLYLNTNKKGITLDLKTRRGKKILKELVKRADILVENFHPRVMPSLGLSYEELEKINPKLVMTSITNFGQSGPYRDYKALEINLAALGGPMYKVGSPERKPLKEPASTFQFTAGADACAATLTGAFQQIRYKVGQHIDFSILESVICCLGYHPIGWSRTGLGSKRMGPGSAATPWPVATGNEGIYACKDGYVVITVGVSDDLVMISALTGSEEVLSPEIKVTPYAKLEGDKKLHRILVEKLKEREKEEVFQKAQEMRLWWASVKDVKEIFEWGQYRERNYWVSIDHPETGPLTYARTPFLMSQTPARIGRAPLMGEHNEEVYCQYLGYSKEELVKLRQMGVI